MDTYYPYKKQNYINLSHVRKRETNALIDAQRTPGLYEAEGFIVTRSEQETLSTEEGTITILPTRDFLLRLEQGQISF
ncbi:hypothetical protein NBH05_06715 [Akkermansia sp. B2-R-115]|nr:hypothetical protein [Akkermansia sp. B2-R-115]